MSSTLSYRQIKKSFGNLDVLKELDLTVAEGEYMCLLGPSGCGKTTLLRMAAGLATPSSGSIFIGDCDVTYLETGVRNVGLAFQNYALYPNLTVGENLAFPLRSPRFRRKLSAADITERVRRIAALMRVEHLLERRPDQISGGQKQRIALGRALIRDPSVLLLDEPITHLDARLRYEMRTEIKELHRAVGMTSLHVTHDQQEAMAIADRIALMENGRVVQIGTPDDIYANPTNVFAARFIGDPPMSVLDAAVDGRMLVLGEARFPMPEGWADGRLQGRANVQVGLRDKAFRVADGGLAAKVSNYESMGSEVELVAQSPVGEIRLRTRNRDLRLGSQINLDLDLRTACVFDSGSGDRIG